MLSILISVLAVAVTGTLDTQIWSYHIADDTASTMYEGGSTEYHCFDTDSGTKTFVRGTYGMFGYFEGAVSLTDPHTFYVNWWETVSASITKTSAGSAALTYASDWTSVTGPSWNTASYGSMSSSWDAITGVALGMSSAATVTVNGTTLAGPMASLRYCFYPGQQASSPIPASYATMNVLSTGSSEGTNTFCEVPIGGPGDWAGVYMFNYNKDDDPTTAGIELGVYGTTSSGFMLKSGFGYVGDWHAYTGPFQGNSGPNIYVSGQMDFTADGTQYTNVMVGFYCNVDPNTYERNFCTHELYDVVDDVVNACPQGYTISSDLNPLYKFATEGTNDSVHPQCTMMPPTAPIILGITTFLFMCSTLYLFFRGKQISPA